MSIQRSQGQNGGWFGSNITKPIKIDCNFIVDASNGNGLGIRSLKSNGYVRNVFMHTSSTPGSNEGYLNPNPAVGYAFIQLKSNYNVYLGGFSGFVSPTTGSTKVINATALTIGNPYVIAAVGTVAKPKFTVLAIADSAGNSAGKYFTATDAFGNNFVFYNVVAGIGTPPALVGPLAGYTAIPVGYASGAANTAVGTAITAAVAGVNGGLSFTTGLVSATTTVTSAAAFNVNFAQLPNAQTSGFTVSGITYTTLQADWQHVGLPPGLAPAVGQTFIATTTGGAIGSGTVLSPGLSGITAVEVIGDPNSMIANSNISPNGGAWLMVQFLGATDASTTTLIPKAPAASSVVGMSFFFDGSSVTVDGL